MIGVRTGPRAFMHGFDRFLLYTGTAKGKREFLSVSVGQDGMIQLPRGFHFAFDKTKVLRYVRVIGLIDEFGMTDGVGAVLVDPRVKGTDIHVPNLFARFHAMIEFNGIGASAEKGISWVQGELMSRFFTNCWMSGWFFFKRFHSHSHISLRG